MQGRFDWGRYDFGTFRRRDVLKMGRFDCKATDRQTDGRAIAYSEREREFTFAKK